MTATPSSPTWLCIDNALPPLPHMALCLSQAEFDAACAHIEEHSTPWLNGAAARMHAFQHDTTRKHTCLVCLDTTIKDVDAQQIAALLVHEAVHVAQYYFEEIVREYHPSKEMQAYTIQVISQRLMTAYREQHHES